MPRLLLGSPRGNGTPSFDAVAAMVDSMASKFPASRRVPLVERRLSMLSTLNERPLWRLGVRGNVILVPTMGPRFGLVRNAKTYGTPVVYAWDVWRADITRWQRAVDELEVPLIITSSQEASAALSASGVTARVTHVPEAITVRGFRSDIPISRRPLRVLELGRKNIGWHDSVVDALRSEGVRHMYEQSPGRVIYPTRQAMTDGLATAAISVCFPRSMTFGETATEFTTMTARYLESFASGCLVIGSAPPELIKLFGYNPVVEVDWSDPAAQILAIVADLGKYEPLVNRNVATVRRVGDWEQRAPEILEQICAITQTHVPKLRK